MTASRRRRTRATVTALLAAVAALAAVAVLGVAGVRTLADSTAGRRAEGQLVRQTQRLPFTATGLLGVVDDDGRLTSIAVIVLRPDGVGGTVLGWSPSADVSYGIADELASLDAIWRLYGVDALLASMESMTGLTFDVVEVADQRRFAQLITPLGDLPSDLATPLADGSTGETWTEGDQTLTAPAAARAITAFDPGVADWYLDPARASIWEAVASRVGAGIGSAEPAPTDLSLPAPRTMDELLDRLYAAAVEYRALPFEPIDPAEVPSRLTPDLATAYADGSVPSVVVQDRIEAVMLLASVAPARMGAPLDAPTVRIESNFVEADVAALAPFDLTATQLAKAALVRFLFEGLNVVSIAELPDRPVPDVTQVRVADATLIDVVVGYDELLGPIEPSLIDVPIEGVDVVITLGMSFAEHLRDGG